ncbi:MAG: hypothetical protein ACI8TP_002184 [Acidimicrobiales bacterium]|jgi:uncharacterized protein (DUF952 family)
MAEILHITSAASWAESQKTGEHRDPSLDTEGFIHCSSAEQVLGPANALFKGQSGLILLRIDTEKLDQPLVLEDTYGHGAFPHIYGALNLAAVIGTVHFSANADGSFSLPDELAR